MRKTELTGLQGHFRAALVASVTALLLALPLGSAVAQDKGAAPAPSAAQPAPPAQPTPQAPEATSIVRAEIYGHVDASKKDFKKKVITEATVLGLVSTSSDPVPVGSKGVLVLRVEDQPGKVQWVEIANVTLKKHDAGGKIQLTVDTIKDAAVLPQKNGKPIDPFAKKTKIKLSFDLPA